MDGEVLLIRVKPKSRGKSLHMGSRRGFRNRSNGFGFVVYRNCQETVKGDNETNFTR